MVAVDSSQDSQYACQWLIDNVYKEGMRHIPGLGSICSHLCLHRDQVFPHEISTRFD